MLTVSNSDHRPRLLEARSELPVPGEDVTHVLEVIRRALVHGRHDTPLVERHDESDHRHHDAHTRSDRRDRRPSLPIFRRTRHESGVEGTRVI